MRRKTKSGVEKSWKVKQEKENCKNFNVTKFKQKRNEKQNESFTFLKKSKKMCLANEKLKIFDGPKRERSESSTDHLAGAPQ